MRKTDIVIILAVVAIVVGFIVTAEMPQKRVIEVRPNEVESKVHTRYTAYGRCYTNGAVITDDGNNIHIKEVR